MSDSDTPQDDGEARFEVATARSELLSRLDNADWIRDPLIDAVAESEELDEKTVERGLDTLLSAGEVYSPQNSDVVRRTP